MDRNELVRGVEACVWIQGKMSRQVLRKLADLLVQCDNLAIMAGLADLLEVVYDEPDEICYLVRLAERTILSHWS